MTAVHTPTTGPLSRRAGADIGHDFYAHGREMPFDVSRAKTELGFEAKHDLLDSMQAAQRWVGA